VTLYRVFTPAIAPGTFAERGTRRCTAHGYVTTVLPSSDQVSAVANSVPGIDRAVKEYCPPE
jgi:hypothetical protein